MTGSPPFVTTRTPTSLSRHPPLPSPTTTPAHPRRRVQAPSAALPAVLLCFAEVACHRARRVRVRGAPAPPVTPRPGARRGEGAVRASPATPSRAGADGLVRELYGEAPATLLRPLATSLRIPAAVPARRGSPHASIAARRRVRPRARRGRLHFGRAPARSTSPPRRSCAGLLHPLSRVRWRVADSSLPLQSVRGFDLVVEVMTPSAPPRRGPRVPVGRLLRASGRPRLPRGSPARVTRSSPPPCLSPVRDRSGLPGGRGDAADVQPYFPTDGPRACGVLPTAD